MATTLTLRRRKPAKAGTILANGGCQKVKGMTRDEIHDVVTEVLAAQRQTQFGEEDAVVLRAIASILTSFGMEEDDRKEIRADFIHLRKWRKSVEQAQGYGFKAVVTIIVTGFLGAVWLGFKTLLGK
jgi:hypothetical protein